MYLKDKIYKLWCIIDEHFLSRFSLSIFAISSLLYIADIFLLINTSKILDPILLLIISFIFLSIFINTIINHKTEEYKIKLRKNSLINIICISIILIILQVCIKAKLFTLQTIATTEIIRSFVYFFSYILMVFISIFINTDIKPKAVDEQDDVIEENYLPTRILKFKHVIILGLIIITCSLLIKLYLIDKGNFDLDEGIHTYDAKLILDGKTPFLDYFTREPYYLYLHAFFLKLTAVSMYYSRLLSVIFTIGSAIILFILERKYFKGPGLISPAIYSLAPFFIDKTYLANLYPIFHFVILMIFLLLLRFIDKRKIIDLVLFSLLIGASVHFYRMGIFYILLTFGIILVTIKDKLLLKEKLLIIIPSSITFFIPLITFSYLMGYKKFEIIYGTNELIILFLLSTLLLLLSNYISKIFNLIFSNKTVISLFYFFCTIAFIIVFVLFGQNLYIKSRILFQALLESYFFILPFILVFLSYIYQKASYILYNVIKILIISSILIISVIGINNVLGLQNWSVRLPSYVESIFYILMLISLFLIIFQQKLNIFKYSDDKKILLIFSFTPLIFYIIHSQIFTSTFTLSSIFLILLISYDFDKINHNYKTRLIGAFFFILFLFPTLHYFQPINDRQILRQTSLEIIEGIKREDSNGITILTGLPLYAIETNKSMIYDNSRPTMYQQADKNKLGTPSYINLSKNSVGAEEYIHEIEYKKTKLLLLDSRFTSIIRSNELLNNYIMNTYYKYKTYGNKDYPIYLYKRIEY